MEARFKLDATLGQKIDQAIREAYGDSDPVHREAMLRVLFAAKRQVEAAATYPFADKQAQIGDDFALSLVLSALEHGGASPLEPKSPKELFGPHTPSRGVSPADSLVGKGPYGDNDLRWVKAFVGYISSDPQPFPTKPNGPDIIPLKDDVRIAIAGDWGTGNGSSLSIAANIKQQNPHYTIHLGDVYYSGQPDEELSKFVEPWPAGSIGSLALNSNHEMYSGGIGYFQVALPHPKFRLQGGLSYFLLENENWAIFGLDSAYYSSSFLYDKGQLDPVQLAFLHRHGKAALEDGKQVIVLTHHTGLTLDGKPVEPLWSQVTDALGTQGMLFWYWGHEHAAAAFKPVERKYDGQRLLVKARCIGHGGVPFGPIPANPALDWSEDKQFSGDPAFPTRARNGFVMLALKGQHLTEQFWDETGERRF